MSEEAKNDMEEVEIDLPEQEESGKDSAPQEASAEAPEQDSGRSEDRRTGMNSKTTARMSRSGSRSLPRSTGKKNEIGKKPFDLPSNSGTKTKS